MQIAAKNKEYVLSKQFLKTGKAPLPIFDRRFVKNLYSLNHIDTVVT